LRAVHLLRDDLTDRPFAAPSEERLAELGLGPGEIAAADRAGLLLRIADQLVLLPDTPARAVAVLSRLDQPFTVSAARTALDTTRRVAIPLLELLGRQGLVRRHPDDTRSVVATVDTP
jgi:selenocysteine-specific elongation factor